MRSAGGNDSIVQAALRLFGEHGIGATSLREVAKAAGVSPALVVHHFGGKEGLVAAVDETALRRFGGAAYGSEERPDPPDLLRQRAEQTARVMREHPEVCAYFGRALVEGTPGSARLFRLMIEGGRAEIDALAEKGALRKDADRLWATLQHFFLIWAPLSFMPLLEQEALGGSLLDDAILNRWVAANVKLLEQGLYR
ncbi:MAG TPA: helix-turn-helix domain-containing protein [Solirubrobacterales bacterium]|nr:helix-turn-helix domain-containing protein [Solirubrobacterales bacterium]